MTPYKFLLIYLTKKLFIYFVYDPIYKKTLMLDFKQNI